MSIRFELPSELENGLRRDLQDLDAEAKEALLVDLYRRGKLTHHSLSQALNLDRFETEELLRKHHVTEDLGSVGDYLADAKTLAQLRNPGR